MLCHLLDSGSVPGGIFNQAYNKWAQLTTKLRARLEPTLVPYSLTSVLSVMAVKDVVTTPVKIDVITRPTRTQAMAKIRATNPLGDRSP